MGNGLEWLRVTVKRPGEMRDNGGCDWAGGHEGGKKWRDLKIYFLGRIK